MKPREPGASFTILYIVSVIPILVVFEVIGGFGFCPTLVTIVDV